MDHILQAPKECGMTVEIDLTVLWPIPLGIQQEIFSVQQFLYLVSMYFRSVRNGLVGCQ